MPEKKAKNPLPLVIDSPHSGRNYPAGFAYDCGEDEIKRWEDRYVDLLCAGVKDAGVAYMEADIARSYIDPNRARDGLNPAEVEGGLSDLPYRKGGKMPKGDGLVPTFSTLRDKQLYAEGNKPDEAEIKKRLQVWDDYHAELQGHLQAAKESTGAAWHLNMHSCYPEGAPDAQGKRDKRADITLGDGRGTTSSPAFAAFVKAAFEKRGLSVSMNEPFSGGYIVRHYGRPDENVHSLQIEIRRDLYLDMETLEPNENFAHMQQVIAGVVEDVKGFIAENLPSANHNPAKPSAFKNGRK